MGARARTRALQQCQLVALLSVLVALAALFLSARPSLPAALSSPFSHLSLPLSLSLVLPALVDSERMLSSTTFKDKTRAARAVGSELETAVVKATNHDPVPPKRKHVASTSALTPVARTHARTHARTRTREECSARVVALRSASSVLLSLSRSAAPRPLFRPFRAPQPPSALPSLSRSAYSPALRRVACPRGCVVGRVQPSRRRWRTQASRSRRSSATSRSASRARRGRYVRDQRPALPLLSRASPPCDARPWVTTRSCSRRR